MKKEKKIDPEDYILPVLSPEDSLDVAFKIAKEAFKKTTLTMKDIDNAVKIVRKRYLLRRPWSFDRDGSLFRLVSKSHRVHYVHPPFRRELYFGVTISVNCDFAELQARAEVPA